LREQGGSDGKDRSEEGGKTGRSHEGRDGTTIAPRVNAWEHSSRDTAKAVLDLALI